MTKVGGLDDWHGFLWLPVNDVLGAGRLERISCSRQQSTVSMLPLHAVWFQHAAPHLHRCRGPQSSAVAGQHSSGCMVAISAAVVRCRSCISPCPMELQESATLLERFKDDGKLPTAVLTPAAHMLLPLLHHCCLITSLGQVGSPVHHETLYSCQMVIC